MSFQKAIPLILKHEGGYVNDPALIEQAINAALLDENRRYVINIAPKNPCNAPGCTNEKLSMGLCNAHYIRIRKNKRMDTPVRNRSNKKNCIDCGKLVGTKGGYNRCTNHYKAQRLKIIKKSIVDYMGGKCFKCKKEYPLCVFDFHHIDKTQKERTVGNLVSVGSIKKIAAEVVKCTLLCANCHREVHNEL